MRRTKNRHKERVCVCVCVCACACVVFSVVNQADSHVSEMIYVEELDGEKVAHGS